MIKRIVIAGAPGTGKTEIIQFLKSKKYSTFPDIAREIIKEESVKPNGILPKTNLKQFGKLVLEKRIQQFNNAKDGLNFFDWGIVDIIGYFKANSLAPQKELINAANKYRCDSVFFLDVWEEIFVRDLERDESFSQSCLLSKEIKKAYLDLGYKPIIVPQCGVEKRVDVLLSNIVKSNA